MDQLAEDPDRPYLKKRWLQRLRNERRVPTFTAGGRVLFDVDALDAYIESTQLDPRIGRR